MKKPVSFLAMVLCLGGLLTAQAPVTAPTFVAEVSTDSVLVGNYFTVTFSLEGAQGSDFAFPSFEEFNVVGGPNYSSSMSISNGAMSASVSYTFFLEPRDIGEYYIGPASVQLGDQALETPPVLVQVFPNPDGVMVQPTLPTQPSLPSFWNDDFFQDFFQQPDWLTFPPVDSLRQMVPGEQQPAKRKTTRI